MLGERFYTSPYGLTKVLTHISMLINEPPTLTPRIYSSAEYHNGFSLRTQFTHLVYSPVYASNVKLASQQLLMSITTYFGRIALHLHSHLAFLSTIHLILQFYLSICLYFFFYLRHLSSIPRPMTSFAGVEGLEIDGPLNSILSCGLSRLSCI